MRSALFCLVAALASEPWDSATAQVLAAAMLAGKHQPALGRVILSHGLSE